MTERTESALVPAGDMSWQDTVALGRVLMNSKRFSEISTVEQAVVQVLAGRELGIGPVASMTGIYVIKGRVSVGANLMAQAVKRSTKYDYRVVELSDQAAEIAFLENGKELGRSRFTREDAAKAGTQNLEKFARNMLFARAMSNGVKWFCPDVFSTAVYTPEELGVPVDGEGDIINVTPTQVEKTPQAEPEKLGGNGSIETKHWIDDDKVRARFWAWTGKLTLTDAQVHTALGVEHIRDYAGTTGDAKKTIEAWVEAQAEAGPEAES